MLKSKITYYLAKNHIAGPTSEDALQICKYLASKNYSITLSAWTAEKDNFNTTAKKYIQAAELIINNNIDALLAIKPPAIGFNIDLFKQIVSTAVIKNIRIHFDALSPELSGATLKFLNEAIKIYPRLSYTIPARWDRSFSDAQEIINMNLPAVRIVKGQWLDPANPSIKIKDNFLRIVEKLAGNIHCISIATHDIKLAKQSFDIIKTSGSECELEQFFSLPDNSKKLVYNNFPRIRIYVAYGTPYMPYNIKFIIERPAIFKWVMRDIFSFRPDFKLSRNSNYLY